MSRRLIKTFLVMQGAPELGYFILVNACFCLCHGLENVEIMTALAVFLAFALLRTSLMISGLWQRSQPLRDYLDRPEQHQDRASLIAAEQGFQDCESFYLRVLTLTWPLSLICAHLALWLFHQTQFAPDAALMTGCMVLACACGPLGLGPLITAIIRVLTLKKLAQELEIKELSAFKTRSSILWRTMTTVFFIGLGSLSWLLCLVVKVDYERDRRDAQLSVQRVLGLSQSEKQAFFERQLLEDHWLKTKAERQWMLEQWKTRVPYSSFHKDLERALLQGKASALLVPGRRELLLVQKFPDGTRLQRMRWDSWRDSWLFYFSLFFASVTFILTIQSAFFFAYFLTKPVEESRSLWLEHMSRGDIRGMPLLPSYVADELGGFSQEINHLLRDLKNLLEQTEAITAGDLRVELHGQSDLANSFRKMVSSLNQLVALLTTDSKELASTGDLLLHSAKSLEHSSLSQHEAMTEINELAQDLTGSSQEVTAEMRNIAQCAQNTVVGAQEALDQLSALFERVGHIQSASRSIRAVARQSQLLAINAHIEATRVGEHSTSVATLAREAKSQSDEIVRVTGEIEGWIETVHDFVYQTTLASENTRSLANTTLMTTERVSAIAGQQLASTQVISINIEDTLGNMNNSRLAAEESRSAAQKLVRKSRDLQERVSRFQVRTDS